MDQLKAQTEAMTGTLRSYEAAIGAFQGIRSQLQAEMAAVPWTGGASTVFRSRMARWDENFAVVIRSCQDVANALAHSIQSLGAAEQEAEQQAAF